MARRSPWAAQTRRERKRVRGQLKITPLPEKYVHARAFLSVPRTVQTPEARIAFLKKYRGEATRTLKTEVKEAQLKNEKHIKPELFEKLLNEGHVSGALLEDLSTRTAKNLIKQSSDPLSKNLARQFETYLTRRNIPVDKTTLTLALREYMHLHGTAVLSSHPINFRPFERLYLEERKGSRGFELMDRTIANELIAEAFPHKRLTGNQRRAIRRWIKVQGPLLSKEFTRIRTQFLAEGKGIDEMIQAMDKYTFGQLQAHFGSWFIKSDRSLAKRPVLAPATGKVGSREERMQQYAVERARDVREATAKGRALEERIRAAADTKVSFNVSAYCLEELAKENPALGKRVNQLFKEGKLNAGSVAGLYRSGRLTQRIFMAAVDQHGFEKEFGAARINDLVRFITNIGAKGRKIVTAKSVVQQGRGEAIFHFLEKNGLLETHHGGGTVVYLRRPQHGIPY